MFSALPPKADSNRTSRHVRKVPRAVIPVENRRLMTWLSDMAVAGMTIISDTRMTCGFGKGQMTVSGISHYRGGTIDEVAPLAKKLKAIYLKHGVAYRLSRFQTGPNVGDWFVVVQFADQTAYDKAHAAIAQDPEIQWAFAEIAKFAKRIDQQLVIDLDL